MFVSNAAGATPNIVVILTDDQEDTGSMGYYAENSFSACRALIHPH
jgi:hypothetical protein